MTGEPVNRDRPGTGDVTRRVLSFGPNVDHHDATLVESSCELVTADLFELVSVPEVRGGEIVELFEMRPRDLTQGGPQFLDALGREPV